LPNPYFQFKQFTVQHNRCAMKVSTDACLLGAIAAKYVHNHAGSINRILDIGTGSGLLSLMLAQQHQCPIDAVELDEDAAAQATENFSVSPFAGWLQVSCTDIARYHPGLQYDFIICNPPFFEADLPSPHAAKNKAMHSSHLTLLQLVEQVGRLLSPTGTCMLLLPWHRTPLFLQTAAAVHLHCTQQWLIKQTPAHHWFRSIVLLSTQQSTIQQTALYIKDTDGQYSPEFTALLQPYYLYL
jgi:tRNA1Val (adenine37-N6)-methyltransferase